MAEVKQSTWAVFKCSACWCLVERVFVREAIPALHLPYQQICSECCKHEWRGAFKELESGEDILNAEVLHYETAAAMLPAPDMQELKMDLERTKGTLQAHRLNPADKKDLDDSLDDSLDDKD